MRVYIAADSHLQEHAKAIRDVLVKEDIEVTSRWLDVKLEAFHLVTEAMLVKAAHENFCDIDRALFFIAYNPFSRQKKGTGGRHVELGYALASRKPVLYVGEILENVFHRHPGVIYCLSSGVDDPTYVARSLTITIRRRWDETRQQSSER